MNPLLHLLLCMLGLGLTLGQVSATKTPLIVKLKPTNHVALLGEVNQVSVNQVIDGLSHSSKSHMFLYLDSPGGEVEAGDKLISFLTYYQHSGKNLTCVAERAHSMAFHIMQSCHLRLVTPSAKMMQHQMSLGLFGELTKVNHYVGMLNKISDRLSSRTAQRIGITYDEFQKRVTDEWWVYGNDLIKEKVADAVALVGCDTSSQSKGIITLPVWKCPISAGHPDSIPRKQLASTIETRPAFRSITAETP